MKLDRMLLADCATPDALVTAILRQAPGLPIPVPITEIAVQLDIREIREVETDSFEGGLVAFEDKSEGTILINRFSGRRRQRFTIGHELGHFLNPWHNPPSVDGFRCSKGDMRLTGAAPNDRAARMEVEANRFAAGILLPLPVLRKDLSHLKGMEVGHIVDLAKRYDVSKDATARRYVEEHSEPCAAVVSQNGRLLRCYRNRSFPYVDIQIGQPIPDCTATKKLAIAAGEISDWTAVDRGLWVSTHRQKRSGKILEQILGQQQGYRLTLLALDDEFASEEADDEGDLEESWTPRFRRR